MHEKCGNLFSYQRALGLGEITNNNIVDLSYIFAETRFGAKLLCIYWFRFVNCLYIDKLITSGVFILGSKLLFIRFV